MVDERRPDPDMPKSRAAKNRGNTLWAHLADIRRAWTGAPLSYGESVALVTCGGLGMSYAEAGRLFDTPRNTMMYRYEGGIGKLVAFLNGDDSAMIGPQSA